VTDTSAWATILAGGDGSRLQSLTRQLAGDDRPKQFCPLFNGRTLVAETAKRVSSLVPPERTLYVVTRRHAQFYRRDLAGVRRSHLIEQPVNRGTAAAIVYTLARVRDLAGSGVIGFFPADHYYSGAVGLRHSLAVAYAAAQAHPDRVFLIGAEASAPEVEYGWIQAGATLSVVSGRTTVRTVEHFWEKPSLDQATDLLRRRCLWNTFVTVGRVDAFEALIQGARPDLWAAFDPIRHLKSPREEVQAAELLYNEIPPCDFSREVLSAQPGRLGVVTLSRSAGWTDLGQPSRVLAVLGRQGLPMPRLRLAAG